MSKQIVIIDYNMGNTLSISNALLKLGYNSIVSADEKIINNADALILPGVGAYQEAMKNIRSNNLDQILERNVITNKKPIIGICLGMQIMGIQGEENIIEKGLGWIDAEVKKISIPKVRVPHVGWNSIEVNIKEPLFLNISSDSHFYFDHSFHFICDPKFVSSYTLYKEKIVASIQKDNIFATQFHPEKSQTMGLKLLRNFLNYVEEH
jgi:glutamine amidotransferase